MIDQLKDADRKARKNFVYQGETKDEWRSMAKEALSGKTWRGDCDDLASTACHLAIMAGRPMKDLWFAMVSSTGGKKVDHMVGIARSEKAFYIIGDTFGPIYPASQMQHSLLFVHRLDWPKEKWLRVANVKDLV